MAWYSASIAGGKWRLIEFGVSSVTGIGDLLSTVLWIYFVILIARMVIDFVQVLSRDWTPTGAALVLCEVVYSLTDPPLNLLRKFIPPLRVGGIALDLSFIVLVLALQIAIRFVVML